MNSIDKFVNERTLSREEEVRNAIERELPSEYFGWLAQALLESGCIPKDADVSPSGFNLLCIPRQFWNEHKNHDATVLLILESLLEFESPTEDSQVDGKWTIEPESRAAFVKACSERVDFTGALQAAINGTSPSPLLYRAMELAQMLRKEGLLHPERLIDLEQLERLGREPLQQRGGNSTEMEKLCARVDSPYFWIAMGVEECESALSAEFEQANDNRVVLLARGLTSCAMHARNLLRIKDLVDSNDLTDRVVRWTFDQVDQRVVSEPRSIDSFLRRTWLRLWYICFAWTSFPVEDESARNERLIAAADYELGILRQMLVHAQSEEGRVEFEEQLETLEASACVMFKHRPLWKAMKPLLLAFRELPVAGVAPDLRYWSVSGNNDDMPAPWHRIMEIMINSFHVYSRYEQEDDPNLEQLRCEFCRFCLNRLKPNPKTNQPSEPDTNWRWAYIRAAEALRCNPGSRSQNILLKVSKHDPNNDVRELARKVYTTFRHRPHLPKGLSPRRTVLSALFYLRQAHLISLDIDIDEPGANRTREEEARRTTQSEQM